MYKFKGITVDKDSMRHEDTETSFQPPAILIAYHYQCNYFPVTCMTSLDFNKDFRGLELEEGM